MSSSKGEIQKPRPSAATLPPEMAAEFKKHAGQGLETMTERDKATPFLGLLQQMSPQLNKTEPKYIPGAEQGDIFNTVTLEVFKEGVEVVPVHFEKVWNTWVPRDAGGGFLGSYEDPELQKPIFVTNRAAEYEGEPQVAETANHYVLVRGADGAWTPAIMTMTKTKLGASRQWNTQMTLACQRYEAPTFARVYRVRSVQKKNDKGTFYVYKIEPLSEEAGFVDADGFRTAVAFGHSIKAGKVKVDYTKSTEQEETETPTPDDPAKPKF